MTDINEYKNKTIHFIGIGGCSMSGLAQILKNMGYHVTGSDMRESRFTDTLKNQNIKFTIGHDPKNIEGAGLVVYSAATKPYNPEFAAAKEAGIPMIERAELLGLISKDYANVIGIAGCHGKTTITSMLASILEYASIDSTVHVGGMVDFLSGGVKLGHSDIFVTEACEYVKSFLKLHPKYALINNIDDDHLDCYKDIDEIADTFLQFANLLPPDGILFINGDDELTRQVANKAHVRIISYGTDPSNDYQIRDLTFDELGTPSFLIYHGGRSIGRVKLNVPGEHNAMNALGAICVAHTVFSVPVETCAGALLTYHLAGRRFEFIGERNGVKIFHDYAHHPSEIQACLAAAKKYPHKKMWVLFQCNSYTRARTLKKKYGVSFFDADEVLVPDLYPGRDIDTGDIHATDLVEEINAHSANSQYLGSFQEIKDYLLARWEPGDILVTLGSGDVNKQQMIILND